MQHTCTSLRSNYSLNTSMNGFCIWGGFHYTLYGTSAGGSLKFPNFWPLMFLTCQKCKSHSLRNVKKWENLWEHNNFWALIFNFVPYILKLENQFLNFLEIWLLILIKPFLILLYWMYLGILQNVGPILSLVIFFREEKFGKMMVCTIIEHFCRIPPPTTQYSRQN